MTVPTVAGEVTGAAGKASGIIHALIFDITKIVHLRSQRGWTIDRYELELLRPDALMSVCKVPRATIRAAIEALGRHIARLGGPLKKHWRASGRSFSGLDDLVIMTRARDLVKLSLESIDACPFHLEPDPAFLGRHADTGYATVNVEGGGLFSVRRRDGQWNVGGGGVGRLTMGLGLSPRWAVRAGAELGGAALVDSDISAESVDVDFIAAVPFTIRRLTPTWHYDFEVAAIALGVPWREQVRYGLRVGTLVGVTYLRVRSLLPWGGYTVTFEYVLPRGAQDGQWTVRTGLRVGFNLRALKL